ncbi:MAG: tetratricopeptide repeat protein [Candidatus Dadabacteria bacterium]|nr:MAG: tetratricopeptide repeat protein [Candidatus Dadabacteria bacterium]
MKKYCFLAALIMSGFVQVGCAPAVVKPDFAAKQKAQALVDKGTLALRAGELEKAAAAYSVATEVAPIAAAYDGLGCVAFMDGRYRQAESFYKKALELDENYYDVLGNLALLYHQQGKDKLARRYYLEALKKQPDNYRVRNNYAVFLYEKIGPYNAEIELKKALSLVEHPVIVNNINKLRKHQNGKGKKRRNSRN